MAFTALFGDTLLTKDGLKPTEEVLSGCQAVGLYFSAHWCPPCRAFTPELAKHFTDHLESKGMKIVFVSSDRDDSSFQEYFNEMPWAALPFIKSDLKAALSTKYDVSGIPCFVILDPSGETITLDGRSCVSNDPTGENFPWTSGAQAVGNSQVGGGAPHLEHGKTQAMVDDFRVKQKQGMKMQFCNLFVSSVFCAVYWWAWSSADTNCASKPIKMKDVFLSFGIINIIMIVTACMAVFLTQKLLSDHMIKAQIYAGQNRDAEAQREAEAALNDANTGRITKCLAVNGIGLCCTACFTMVWSIICLVSVFNAANDANEVACEDERPKYWGIFIASMVTQVCVQLVTGKQQKAQAESQTGQQV